VQKHISEGLSGGSRRCEEIRESWCLGTYSTCQHLMGGFLILMGAVYFRCSYAAFRLVKYGELELFLMSL
jgi:hypothetical protein